MKKTPGRNGKSWASGNNSIKIIDNILNIDKIDNDSISNIGSNFCLCFYYNIGGIVYYERS